MSGTRYASENSPFRPERFMSSPSLMGARGLPGNLVAARCAVLDDPLERRLIYFLQALSHREGGLSKVGRDLVAMFPQRIGTRTMRRLGLGGPATYSRADAIKIFGELDDVREREPQLLSAGEALESCRDKMASELPHLLELLCLDPEYGGILNDKTDPGSGSFRRPISVGYFNLLLESLLEYQERKSSEAKRAIVSTEISTAVFQELDYALSQRCLVVVNGNARTGKTCASKAWCEQHLGEARYVQTPASNDDISFFRAIARALGTADALSMKATYVRNRVERTLEDGHLMLAFDEAHYLWPQRHARQSLPSRINWILTALVNNNVPVALITTPQFVRNQRRVEDSTGWTSEQLQGRIGHWRTLPEHPSEKDLAAVAKALLPEADKVGIQALVVYATLSAKWFAGIEFTVRYARDLAAKRGGVTVIRSDLLRAIEDGIVPSDTAMQAALEAVAVSKPRQKPRRPVAAVPQSSRQVSAPVAPLLSRASGRSAGRMELEAV